jgi:predicted dehydrogenase
MSTGSVGIGVIGCGGMGLDMARHLEKMDPRLKTVALCDPDPRSIEKAKATLQYSPTVHADYHELVARPDLHWVIIASWNNAHADQTVAAFNAGKHVFCQKPLALTVDECARMYSAWKKSGKMFNIGFSLRYAPHYRKIKEVLASGKIGKILSMEFNETLEFNHGGFIMGNWRRLTKNAGTHLLEKCCHDIDLANWMVDSIAKRVASFGGLDFFIPENAHHVQRLGKKDGKPAYSIWPDPDVKDPFLSDKDLADNQVAIIEYENGVRATFHSNCNAAIPERRMYILGTEGALRADLRTAKIEVARIGFDEKIEEVSVEVPDGHGGGDAVLALELLDSMLKGIAPSVGLMEGLHSAITCFAIDDAMEKGTVVDLASYWEKAGIKS